ncbi:MAG TPA: PIG-L family deacetylase [Phycicoccus sp.]|nr:PIG-L family deacetylase [Phycicoccus sp.]
MTTIVFVQAHPDDEASAVACTMSIATDRGDRVVTVYATNGDHGEAPTDLAEGETVVQRRRKEAEGSAAVTGSEIRWLDYADSGMFGWEQNDLEGSFHAASTDEAGGRLAAILDEVRPDVVVGYDFHGNYGHPDHVKVHHVTKRALALHSGSPRYLESTINRDFMRRMRDTAVAMGVEVGDWNPDQVMEDGHPLGTPESDLHWQVDGREVIERKRAALGCHASQTSDVGMMLAIPEEAFREGWGFEHFSEPALGVDQPMRTAWPF